MKMYLCRDEDGLLQLLFEQYPYKKIYEKIIVWYNDSEWGYVELDRDLYPEVTFENSPQEVELLIKPKK